MRISCDIESQLLKWSLYCENLSQCIACMGVFLSSTDVTKAFLQTLTHICLVCLLFCCLSTLTTSLASKLSTGSDPSCILIVARVISSLALSTRTIETASHEHLKPDYAINCVFLYLVLSQHSFSHGRIPQVTSSPFNL